MSAPSSRARPWMARLFPWALLVAALPLLAPTCGGQQPGPKVFAKGSLIIPMDACYQNTPTPLGGTTYATPYSGCPSNGGTTSDHGNVMRAYGLVYQLLRNNIPVYWVINPGKTGVVDTVNPDATVSYATGGAVGPVGKYGWSNDSVGAMPPNNTGSSIAYQGGPFVVDGSDAAAARSVVLQAFKGTFSAVNVHVSNVAFSANVAKAMVGNFANSGGAQPPPIALLNITGGDGKNSESVVLGYLVDAGLGPTDFPGAGGTATATGHGKIYDDLYAPDFLPTTCSGGKCPDGSSCATGSACAPALTAFGYSILWVPHWYGLNSETHACNQAGCTTTSCVSPGVCGPPFPAGTTYRDVLSAIRGYLDAKHDVLAECAGLGTFEGVNGGGQNGTSPAGFEPGTPAPATQLQTAGATAGGVNINELPLSSGRFIPTGQTTFATPFLQIGDFPFTPATGAIQQYRPTPNPYVGGVVRLIGDTTNTSQDYFTWLQPTSTRGNLVYLAGHDYSGGQSGTGAFQVAGARLVLNTLFNLGNACVPTHAACNTGLLGACSVGEMSCCSAADVAAGRCSAAQQDQPFCKPTVLPGDRVETCNGLDDDCDGIVDNHLTEAQFTTATACYPTATAGCTQTAPGAYTCQGVCHAGTWTCSSGAPACVGAQTPGTEICNGLDDDCNGTVDDNLTPPGGSASCYTGPAGTAGVGLCHAGTWACQSATWVCNGQVLPAQERCEGTLQDYNCNGVKGDGCDCALGSTQPCPFPSYPGYNVTPGIGICRAGTQTCVAGAAGSPNVWGACTGQVLPHLDASNHPAEICGNGLDDDCNGVVDDPAACDCKAGDTLPCYPAGTPGCTETSPGVFSCTGVCAPGVKVCAGGKFGACAAAVTPSTAEKCNGKNDTCAIGWSNDDAVVCSANVGWGCVNGVCTLKTPGEGASCLAGYVSQLVGSPAVATCVPVNCPSSPCPAGWTCQGGTTCVDPCAGKVCGEGAYCSGGACVAGGCTAASCAAGSACRNGTCQADPCAAFTCPAGTFCRGNFGQSPPVADCVRPCATVVCPQGQACGADGFCAPDPCATVTCPANQACKAGSCVADPCPPGSCGPNQVCADGRCTDDPCAGSGAITCPVGVCSAGQCYDPGNLHGYGSAPPATSTTKSGGGCGSGPAGPGSLLLALLGLPLARRRRAPSPRRGPGRGALVAGLALLLALGGAACGKSSKVKPDCETCGGDTCVDVRTSAANCGSCGHACAAGQACGAGTCVASAAVPAITGVTPALVSGNATVTVTGTGFGPTGTKLRVSGAVAQAELVPATLSSSQLTAAVDLTAVGSGNLQLQVVNPDRTVSNVWSLPVGTPPPQIAGLAPKVGDAGTVVTVAVSGSSFTSNAVCVQKVGTTETVIVPSARTVPTSLTCALDLRSAFPSTTVDVMVQNENNVRSPAFPFQVRSPGPPTVSGLSPNQAPQGSVINLLVSGSSFEPSSTVEIAPGTTGSFSALPTVFVYTTSLRASLALQGYAAGAYQVRVRNSATEISGTATFTVQAGVPVASNLTVTPATPVLGQSGILLALSGSSFNSGCALEIQPPLSGAGCTGAFRALATTFVSPQTLQATASLNQAGDCAGTWNAHANCGTSTTAALPFAVASNQAALISVSPAGGAQGASVPVTLAGSNFLPGMTLTLDGAAVGSATVASATSATATLSLAGVNTGGRLLRAVNPGATPSNPIAFSVTPGVPAISAVALTCSPSTGCSGCTGGCPAATTSACAVQQPGAVQVTITGSNFGTGVSTVYVSSALTGKIDISTVPSAGTPVVLDATHIQLTLDTTAIYTTAVNPPIYTLTVENPGAASNPVQFTVKGSGACP